MTPVTAHCMDQQTDQACNVPNSADMAWFDEARYGLFLHWGLYSILSDPDRNEWVLHGKNLDRKEYNLLTRQFYAQRYDPKQWALMALRAGMKYVVLTTRHHDGFCLFDTKTTSFNALNAAVGRDLIAEYVAALREAGLRIGLYYSIKSWQWPAITKGPGSDPEGWEGMVRETHEQVRELMTNYGKIDLLWYDGCVVPGVQDSQILARYWRSAQLNAMVRRLQPGIIINNRSGLDEDYSTPEQHVAPPVAGRRWEACMTLNQNWAYNIHDREFKSPATLKAALIRCARYGGNLLLGIGPRADGSIQDEFVTRLNAVGDWLQSNGPAIFNSQRTRYTEAEHVAGPVTQRDNIVYVHLKQYVGPTVRIDGLADAVDVSMLGQSITLSYRPTDDGALDVSGLTEQLPWDDSPLVLRITMSHGKFTHANCLGGGDELRITAGNVPVLGYDASRYAPPVTPVYSGQMLGEELDQQQYPVDASDSEKWMPGWRDWQVFSPTRDNTLSLQLEVPARNAYELELGLIAQQTGEIRVSIDGKTLEQTFTVSHPGCADTWRLPSLVLEQGTRQITITSDKPFGLYALRCNACWHPLQANQWMTIGPFPTDFATQGPYDGVRKMMEHTLEPEKTYDPNQIYDGVNGMQLRWTHSDVCEGEHSQEGVNFPYRCGDKVPGICMARTVIESPDDRDAQILLGCDWWANARINGELITSNRTDDQFAVDGCQFSRWKPRPATMRLNKGRNVLLVKCHPGGCANWFTFRISDPGDLTISID